MKRHYKVSGVQPRIHGHRGRRAPNATSFNDIENVVKFIKKYGEDNGLPMPAAPRSRNDISPVFLPAYETKVHVHSVYKDSCIASDKRPVGLTLFKNIWLPAYETKVHVHSVYKDSCIASDKRPVGLTLFKNIWLPAYETKVHVCSVYKDSCIASNKLLLV